MGEAERRGLLLHARPVDSGTVVLGLDDDPLVHRGDLQPKTWAGGLAAASPFCRGLEAVVDGVAHHVHHDSPERAPLLGREADPTTVGHHVQLAVSNPLRERPGMGREARERAVGRFELPRRQSISDARG